ncbi:MAG TPA: hypothetical protein VFQ60_04010 [Patescibacteria group bacterium]|nr:hypothetical protein [Patescibacteria group bacterium]
MITARIISVLWALGTSISGFWLAGGLTKGVVYAVRNGHEVFALWALVLGLLFAVLALAATWYVIHSVCDAVEVLDRPRR